MKTLSFRAKVLGVKVNKLSIAVLSCLCFLSILAPYGVHSIESKSSASCIREVPIQENNEPLIDLREQKIIDYDPAFLQENPDATKVRETVYKKLCAAQKLLPSRLRLRLNVGLRSLKVQEKMFADMYKHVQKKFPSMGEKELFLETSKFIAPVKSWEGVPTVPPHSTGGAIDLILINADGSLIDMGVNLEDPYNEDFIRTDSNLISLEARKNRNIMAQALLAAGFINYPGEFWHWSYGDRRWAFVTGAAYSIYGPIAGK